MPPDKSSIVEDKLSFAKGLLYVDLSMQGRMRLQMSETLRWKFTRWIIERSGCLYDYLGGSFDRLDKSIFAEVGFYNKEKDKLAVIFLRPSVCELIKETVARLEEGKAFVRKGDGNVYWKSWVKDREELVTNLRLHGKYKRAALRDEQPLYIKRELEEPARKPTRSGNEVTEDAGTSRQQHRDDEQPLHIKHELEELTRRSIETGNEVTDEAGASRQQHRDDKEQPLQIKHELEEPARKSVGSGNEVAEEAGTSRQQHRDDDEHTTDQHAQEDNSARSDPIGAAYIAWLKDKDETVNLLSFSMDELRRAKEDVRKHLEEYEESIDGIERAQFDFEVALKVKEHLEGHSGPHEQRAELGAEDDNAGHSSVSNVNTEPLMKKRRLSQQVQV